MYTTNATAPINLGDKFQEHSNLMYGILVSVLVISLLINIHILVSYIRERKYQSSYHMTFLNVVAADILLACYGAIVSTPR